MRRSSASIWSSVFVAIGLVLVYVWSSLSDHTFSLKDSLPQLLGVNPRAFFLGGIFALSAGYMALPRAVTGRLSHLAVLMPVVGSVGTACIAMAPFQLLFPPGALCAAGLIALGFSYCWFVTRYGLLFVEDGSVGRIAYCIAAALIMEPVVRVGLESTFNQSTLTAIAMALPLVSAALLYGAQRLVESSLAAASAVDGEEIGAAGVSRSFAPSSVALDKPICPRSLFARGGAAAQAGRSDKAEDGRLRATRARIVMLLATALLLATVRTLSPVGTWDSPFDPTPMTSSAGLVLLYAVCVALFARFAVVDTEGASALKRFQPAFLLVVLTELTSIVVLYTQGPQSAILYTSMCLNDSFAHILFWATVFCVVRSVHMPSHYLAGLGLAAYAASSIAWLVLIGEAEMLETVASVAAITILYILTIVAVKTGEGRSPVGAELFVEGVAQAPVAEADSVPVATDRLGESIEERCLEIAREKGLSPRETDVMVLLAQGRTRLYIQEELFIAENTVKTHIAHIYKKLAVGNRQELLDLVYQKSESA